MDINNNIHYQRIKEIVSEDVWQRILVLKPKTLVEFNSIYRLGDATLAKIQEEVDAIEKEYLSRKKTELDPSLKYRLESLRDRLINISQRNNIIWNSKELSSKLIDLSRLTELSRDGIKELLRSPKKKVYLMASGLTDEEQKKLFVSIYRENERQVMEKGRSILFITPAILNGKTKVEGKDIRLRAPLFLFPIILQLDKSKDAWYITMDDDREVVTNPFIERYILNDVEEFNYEHDLSLIENIERLSRTGRRISVHFNDLEKFEKVTTKDPWPYTNGEFSITNGLLMGLFSDFSSEIEAELDRLIYNMDSTPMLTRFLSNEDFHSRGEVVEAKRKVENSINDDSKLVYTNRLNEQQLRSVKLLNLDTVDGLTIWGPPGTGKSETIISIIENAVAKGQRVAVVSEKQAALDVIKYRLKNIENNSIMISDTKDKNGFFKQLGKMVNREFYTFDKTSTRVKKDLRESFSELDLIYEKFGFNNKNLFEQMEEIFNRPIYETQESRRLRYDDKFDPFKNLSLETFKKVYEFIESIDSRDRLKLIITVSNNYFGKFKSFNDIEETIKGKIREESAKASLAQELLNNSDDISYKLKSFKGLGGLFKKMSYKKSLVKKYNLTKQDFKDLGIGTFDQVQKQIIENANKLKDSLLDELEWVEMRRSDVDSCLSKDVNELNLVSLINIDDIANSKEAIELNLIRLLLKSDAFISKMDVLTKYDDKIDNIKELQNDFTSLANIELLVQLDRNLNNLNLNKRENSILKLANSKRHKPIRPFMNEYAVEVKSLVKVWLLQPEVIPALFDISDTFDLVIFDEASQVFLERSLPAIARAKKIVVLGDEKQLGPSSFFAGRITSEENEDDLLDDEESLLTYSRSKLPEIMLKKHYRSKDVNLIKFSSDRYYEGGLDFINDNNFNEESLEYHYVEESNYNDGKNEAEGDRVIEILREFKDKDIMDTIGVITANSKQELYIFNKVLTEDFELFEWLKDSGSFIKSIENVQGDERDIIVLSTTYGPENGVQRINFGPINQKLGSNRINVAVTRAKKKMVVVSSLDLEQAKNKVQKSLHQGPKDFIDYVSFVKWVSLGQAKEDEFKVANFEDTFRSEVERIVRDLADDYGFKIKTNYEGLGYILDIVVHDEKTNRDILTILLDSPQDDRGAREKDFLAQEFLESRGWNVHRIWSPNWWTRNKKEIALLEEIFVNISNEIEEQTSEVEENIYG